MNNEILKRLENYLRQSNSWRLPEIHFFNGLADGKDGKPFSTTYGEWAGKTLEESLGLFLDEQGF